MRTGTRLMGSALAIVCAVSCWLPACGGGDDDLFGSAGTGGGTSGMGGSKAGSGGSAGSGVGGGAQGGSNQGGSNQGGNNQGGSNQGGSNQGGSNQGGSGQGGSGFGGSSGNCPFTDSIDHDGDSWSFTDGDCNDCDAQVNPGAFDDQGPVGKAGVDDDCDGTPDNSVSECDTGLALDDANPLNGAKALGLCSETSASATGKNRRWGVLSARYTKADGSDGMAWVAHGLMPEFGPAKAQQGASMLVLSSGTARAPGQPGYQSPSEGQLNLQGSPPPGFPKASTLCPGVSPSSSIYDPAALEVQIRVPTNAKGLGYRLNLYTYEYPDYACSQFNDLFVVLANPAPPGAQSGNISFDPAGNTLGVNCSLLQVCLPKTVDGGAGFPCPLGTGLLAGTGFESGGTTSTPHAATGWLATTSPATPGSIVTLRFAVADVGDGIFNTTVLMDRFEWLPPITAPSTQPVANPL